MKKIFVIILLCFTGVLFAQTLPKGFKINPDLLVNTNAPAQYGKVNVPLMRTDVISSSTIASNFISDIFVVGDTVWFGTGKGVSKTYDKGVNFYNYYGTAPFGTDDVSGLAIYNNWIVVATAYSQKVGTDFVPTGTGLKVSSDYGNTWRAYPQSVDGRYDTTIVYGSDSVNNRVYALPITVAEDNLSYDVLITRKNLTSDSLVFWTASWAGELRKSTDFGATFRRVLLPPDDDTLNFITPGIHYSFQYNPRDVFPGNDNHKVFSLAAENDSTIYVGTAGGINKSTDWGISWRRYDFTHTGAGNGIAGNFVVALRVQKYGGRSILWGATNAGAPRTGNNQLNGVSFTTNSGLNWSNTLTTDAEFSHNFGFKDSIVYACTDNGIWRSYFTPNAFTWSKPSAIYDETIKDELRTSSFYSAGAQGNFVWVGSADGLARTVDSVASPWVGKWKIFRSFRALTSNTETYAAPNPFEPKLELCRIYFKTGKASANVTIKIFDFGMNYVRTLLQNAPRTDDQVIWTSWDGKRDDGMQVANGVYFYRIEVNKETTAWGKILVLQ